MKKKLTKKIVLEAFLLLVIIISSVYMWRGLPQTVIRSDGFVHMLDWEQQRFWGQKLNALTGIEVGASIYGALVPKLLGPNVSLYLWLEVGYIVFINLIFYWCVSIITKSKIIAFTATILAGASYFGMWGAYGHCYCYFLERAINMPFMIASFACLHIFLVSGKKFFYLFSLFLFLIGIGLGHLELMMTPVFMLYPFWWHFIKSRFQGVWKGTLIGISFLLISFGISIAQRVTYSGWGWPEWTLREFIFNQAKYDSFGVMARHLFYLTDYAQVIKHLNSSYILRWISSPPQATAGVRYVLFIYAIVFIILFARLAKFRALLLTCLSGSAVIIFLNAYIRLSELVSPGANRYLYFIAFLLSIFWAIALWNFFLNTKGIRVVIGIVLVIVYLGTNIILIDTEISRNLEWGLSTKMMFDYIIQTRKNLSPKTLVVAGFPEIWVQEAQFFNQTIGRREVKYISDRRTDGDWTVKIPEYNHVLRIGYNTECQCIKKIVIK